MEYNTAALYKTALLAGAVLGGTVSVLLAPTSGEETRKFLRDTAESVRKVTRRPAHEAASIDENDAYARKLDALHIRSGKEVEMQNRLVTMGFITGAIIGGIVGLLYAPKTGKETREFLKTTAAHTKEEAYILAEHAKELAIEKARKAKEAAEAAAAAAAATVHKSDAAEAKN